MFEYAIVYEDRSVLHTSRWRLEGVSTKSGGSTDAGWLWMNATAAGDTLTVDLFKDAACGADDKIATGEADISGLASAPVKVTLAAANASGVTGELYVESRSDDASAVPMLITLCTDADLTYEHRRLSSLPNYDGDAGMADYCAVATEKVLLLTSQMFAEQLGGYGAPEHRNLTAASRSWPDYRRLAEPKQLRDAAAHCALEMIFIACHELADDTMYSELAQRHERKFAEAVASWNPAFNTDPDIDDDADETDSAAAVRLERI